MRDLIVPKRAIWTPPRAEVRLHNHFLAELRDAKTGKLVQQAEAENVVTNEGRKTLALYTFNDKTMFMSGCVVGTGSSAPASTDTTLAQQVAEATVASAAQTANPDTSVADPVAQIWYRRRKYQFSETVANAALTEVGLIYLNGAAGTSANNTAPKTVCTRALFRDANGSPIAVTKDGSQILTITVTVYIQRGAVDQNMALLDLWLNRQAATSGGETATAWFLGDGTTPPTNADSGLAGLQLASKRLNSRNSMFWDGAAWTTIRPPNKEYVTTEYVDWGLLEANVTFTEVYTRKTTSDTNIGSSGNSMIRLVFPCGNVAAASYTKTDQVKLRQYYEIAWG